ncbi:unnamed protein product, partial [Heterotrigona itama]
HFLVKHLFTDPVITEVQIYHLSQASTSNTSYASNISGNGDNLITSHFGVDIMMMLKGKDLPPLNWKLGRITAVHPGKSSIIRVVSIKTTDHQNMCSIQRAPLRFDLILTRPPINESPTSNPIK